VLRRILHLVLLLLIFGFIVGALRGSVPHLPAKAALVIQPRGEIVEQLASDPIRRAFDEASGQGENQTLLWDLTDAIRAAAKDQRVKAIVLRLDEMQGAGQPTLEEVAGAMRAFRATGKKIIAQSTSYTQAQYYLAAQADEIYLDPAGEVLIEGYERYRMYYKGLLDKLSIDMHLFRVGAFKSAAEDMVRTDMSAEDRIETQAYLGALWNGYKSSVATARKLAPEVIDQYANGYIDALKRNGGDSAVVAKEAGLVTALKTDDEVTARVIGLVGKDGDSEDYAAISFDDYVHVLHAEQRLATHSGSHVGVVVASGEIQDGDQPPGTVGGLSTSALLREARDDDDIAAVVLRIDSPGGSVLASEQIYREVVALKASGKPVVVSMGDLAASGGYYIAAPADKIFASANTITGSIGIFATLPTVDRILNKVGVTVDGVGTTTLSGKLRVDRPLDPVFSDYIQLSINHGYELFLAHVAAGRKTTRDAVHENAQGRVWIGTDAKRLGLVDQLGGYDEAVKAAALLARLPAGYGVERVEPELTWAEQLALQVRMQISAMTGKIFGTSLGALNAALAPLAPLRTELERVQRLTATQKPLAYCFCSVE
jgi:protease IV